ncbi:hypothetical protein CYLTODRAFT_449891 [Cylindrobasidium torrendii FP15055 ss-10]|uniref:DNA/RNA-binding protein Alba-like domain-containing protein n=1 Tax=Cylindrobasidium torrendii FP15055 ss-10 TaxID=1314674 RepID=A0A0D7BPJ4_9AGAR|nr:hypothetical protein CYLTODRAFT_449891 [Cylindrobasidium torrendii FP15055 ss-10]
MAITEIRITQHGKMKDWVGNALKHFETPNAPPLTFHTLSATPSQLCTNTTPRLISVVEIIKREYLSALKAKQSPRLEGLHQYNQVCILEETLTASTVGDKPRNEQLVDALSGSNPKHVQTPYMRITLSVNEIPQLKDNGATYQPPLRRKLTKSAKSRVRKRKVKEPKAA